MNFARRRRSAPVITIVSMIDIMTILLIFFIVTTTFKSQQPQVQIVLPEVKTAVAKENKTEPAILAISKDNDVYLEDKPVALTELGARFKQLQDQHRPLALRVDEKASYGRVLEVLDTLRLAGVKDLPAFTHERH